MSDLLTILIGDCRETLRGLADNSVHCCVTSPPYFGLRDYGTKGQIGLEPTVTAYVSELVSVFREVRRILRNDGTLWLNLGDSYARSAGARTWSDGRPTHGPNLQGSGQFCRDPVNTAAAAPDGMKPKDLIGVPWRLAFALQADGWWLRQDIIWHKPNPMPESVTDRCTKAHEYVFLLAKSGKYFFDAAAIAEVATGATPGNTRATKGGRAAARGDSRHRTAANLHASGARGIRNARSVWSVASQPFAGQHFATMPVTLARRCIVAGCPSGGLVLDPFGGSGTTAKAAVESGRRAILCEINPDCAAMAETRTATQIGLGLVETPRDPEELRARACQVREVE